MQLHWLETAFGKSSESVQCAITGPCLRMRHRPSAQRTVPIRKICPAFLWSVQFPMSSRFTSSFRAGRKIILQFTDTAENCCSSF